MRFTSSPLVFFALLHLGTAAVAGKDRPLVMIDAGHGGRDPGTIAADGTREKDVTLATALAIRDELLRGRRVRVALTREDDRFVDLAARPILARARGAALLLSIHADSAPNRAARGASVYTLAGTASDGEAARLAARENGRLVAQPAEVRAILADLTQRSTMAESAGFARLLQRALRPALRLRAVAHRSANFAVLRSGGVPAVLFETGYLSNSGDAAVIRSVAGQRAIARAAAWAIEVQLARVAVRGR